jgi:hypothetical protein
MSRRVTCLECAGSLPAAAATGRPRSYCGNLCRKAAEYRLRRVQALLLAAERSLLRSRAFEVSHSWVGKTSAEIEFWQGEVARLTADLRTNLAAMSAETEE